MKPASVNTTAVISSMVTDMDDEARSADMRGTLTDCGCAYNLEVTEPAFVYAER
jgi:hypothetical protein